MPSVAVTAGRRAVSLLSEGGGGQRALGLLTASEGRGFEDSLAHLLIHRSHHLFNDARLPVKPSSDRLEVRALVDLRPWVSIV